MHGAQRRQLLGRDGDGPRPLSYPAKNFCEGSLDSCASPNKESAIGVDPLLNGCAQGSGAVAAASRQGLEMADVVDRDFADHLQ